MEEFSENCQNKPSAHHWQWIFWALPSDRVFVIFKRQNTIWGLKKNGLKNKSLCLHDFQNKSWLIKIPDNQSMEKPGWWQLESCTCYWGGCWEDASKMHVLGAGQEAPRCTQAFWKSFLKKAGSSTPRINTLPPNSGPLPEASHFLLQRTRCRHRRNGHFSMNLASSVLLPTVAPSEWLPPWCPSCSLPDLDEVAPIWLTMLHS